ncbi:phage tail tape measure protein [Geobacillus stearothermophilus]|uniref:phage tail tape measure protein n=1 Tax=Geobacillus stearothermophilus TaxID=1422 RepID=UPI002E203CF0|nr:phage tail tape measure protein [Geobacillus stearothermophilus]MED3732555.1 phage tail tape measure protein [Geobacillus stearothermophilus]MED3765968.1 phage tail tape measure protein [Geobacillus stearothermophilus]
MARKVLEVSFHIAGRLGSSFTNAFASASAKAEKLKQEAKELKASLRSLDKEYKNGKLSAEQYAAAHQKLASQLEKNVQKQKQLQVQMKKQQQMMKNLNDFRGRATTTVASVLPFAAASAASTAAAYSSIHKAMDFEAQLSAIKAVTGLTNTEMQQMRSLALEVGAKTKYSALEAAQGIEELLKAGISPAIVKAGGLEAALNLATAGGLELSEAAEVMSDSLYGFKKDALTAAQVANILAGAANASSTDVHEMKYALSAVGPVADGIGVSFKEVNATLALFSNNMLKGSDAGTSLKTFLSNVQPKSKKAAELFRKYGLILKDGTNILFDTNGQLKDMAEVAEILHQKFGKLSDKERTAAFFEMFGSDSIRAATILAKEGADGIKKMYDEMSKVTALDVAKEKMNNAAGAVEQLRGAFETLQIIAAEGTLPIIKKVAQTAASIFENNTGRAEKFGKRAGKALDDILSPFTTTKPTFNPLRAKMDPGYLEEYRAEWEKWNKFKDMDFSDKVIYALDETATKIENWVNGPGGKKFEAIFAKLAEISVNAYVGALKGLLTSALNQIGQGNFASAAGLGLLANILTGGLLAKGAISAGKHVWGKRGTVVEAAKKLKGKTPPTTSIPPTPPKQAKVQAETKLQPKSAAAKVVHLSEYRNAKSTGTASKVAEQAAKSSGKLARAGKALSKAGKVAGKLALPISLATEAYSIYKAKDKTKATVQAAGGLAGGWAGAKIGAALGTAIAPGIGTAIGGVIGSIGGFLLGKFAAGKATDAVRAAAQPPGSASTTSTQPTADANGINQRATSLIAAMVQTEQNFRLLTMYIGQATGRIVGAIFPLAQNAQLASTNMSLLTMYTGQSISRIVGAIFPLAQNAQLASHNMTLLTMYTGQASGKIVGGIFPIATHGAQASNNISLLAMYAGRASGWIASLFGVQSSANLVKTNLSLLAMYIGKANGWVASIYGIQTSAGMAKGNMSLLASYIGKASGWVASIYGIQSAADVVKSALNRLAARIDSVPAPRFSGGGRGRVEKHARGGIFRKAHVGMVAEAGKPEAIIPIRPGDPRSLSLYEQTGRMLGLGQKSKELTTASVQQIHITFAPVIHGAEAREIEPVLKRERINFESQMNSFFRKKARVSYT